MNEVYQCLVLRLARVALATKISIQVLVFLPLATMNDLIKGVARASEGWKINTVSNNAAT